MKHLPPITKFLIDGEDGTLPQQQTIADRLHYPLKTTDSSCDYVIYVTHEKIELHDTHHPQFKPFSIDFLTGKHRHRQQYGGGKNQPLGKALGLNKFSELQIIDATAGSGSDLWVIASLGYPVLALERHPVLFLLLNDALQRCTESDDAKAREIASNITLKLCDSHHYLQQLDEDTLPDVIYLDPMFPSRDKSAKVKKTMQIFHDLVGSDNDSSTLLTLARQKALKRVVVKRPVKSDFIDCKTEPNFQIIGKTTRYDIYLPLTF